MNNFAPWLIANLPQRVTYEVGRLEELRSRPVVAGIVAAALVALLGLSWLVYRRERTSLPRGLTGLLSMLRTLALLGIVVLALDIVKREARDVTEPSRVVLLVDTSQSMGLPAETLSTEQLTRRDEIVRLLEQSHLFDELQQTHTVEVVRFSDRAEPVTSMVYNSSSKDAPPRPDSTSSTRSATALNWMASLEPTGSETRVGDAVQSILQRYVGLPLSGIVIFSDGGQNAGSDPVAAAEAALNRPALIHTVGFGALSLPPNLAVRELVAPKRAYPGDRITVTGVLSAHGLGEKTAQVELLRQPVGVADAAWESIAEQQLALDSSGLTRIEFSTTPSTSGEFIYELRAAPLEGEGDLNDNARRAEVTVVDRKLRVLMFAGGPLREYQFLRNQLQRDKNISLDVLLQSAGANAAQDAENVLTQFPDSSETLFEYDAIVAFDPDWSQLDEQQVHLLEAWVAEQAGGMIVVPGPIYAGRWIQSQIYDPVRALYPVVFDVNEVLLAPTLESNANARPVELTREGATAEFLRLHDDPAESAALWEEFPGVYGEQPGVVGAKPGATVYMRTTPAGFNSQQAEPIFLAEQFYGSGRVFYENSAELWRLRTLDPALFERLYAKLIQHVAEGRLQRGSARGSLLIERNRYQLGETVVVRARLTNQQLQPLVEESVEAQILQPDARVIALRLQTEVGHPGQFTGEFRVAQQGEYAINLAIPEATQELTERISVTLPALEQQPLVRDVDLLRKLAAAGGGHYYATAEELLHGSANLPALPAALPGISETKIKYSQPDETFAEQLRLGMLIVICTALFSEWIVRRWNRLA